jgi:hypothetical protein
VEHAFPLPGRSPGAAFAGFEQGMDLLDSQYRNGFFGDLWLTVPVRGLRLFSSTSAHLTKCWMAQYWLEA